MELTEQAPGVVGARARVRGRRGRAARAQSRRVQTAGRAETGSAPAGAVTRRGLEDLWDRHGASVYALACALLADETAAARAVRLGMTDLTRSEGSVSLDEARRSWARHVYWRSQELGGETSRTLDLPPTMVCLGRLARLQRASLALCVFGGLTHSEAAALLDVPPSTVADLLTAGLRELGRLAAGASATCA